MAPGEVIQSVLSPAGAQAQSIHQLWLLLLWVSAAIFTLVLAFVAFALLRGARRLTGTISSTPERALSRGVAVAVAMTVVVLLALLVASVQTGRTVASLHAASAVTVAITGHQWWWEIEYEDTVPSRRVVTANEIHIPIGTPVVFKVTSRDVIHSFWAPNLQGKRDLIPGYTTAIWLQADAPAIYRGQCAEFCGRQHAKMAIEVVAQPEADFEQWLDGQRQIANPPPDEIAQHGLHVFMSGQCVACHTIRGTLAHGQLAPDLTHVASRRTIGAGTLSNTRSHLAQWIVNSQASKPGNAMPPNVLADADVLALVVYLETLR